jgi:DNA/RNA endonuclease YhcR with UshA esterase domain
MTDKIIYIALCISILGLLILTYVSEVIEPPVSSIRDINANSVGKNLHVIGKVSEAHSFSGGSAVLTIDDGTGKIDAYVGYSTAKSMPGILKAKTVSVTGEIDEYKGSLEIKADKPDSVRIIL